ncbi:putative phosphatidylglycerol/phosphatidylinositol transfer protein DDB_G0278295 [Dysidea avara]|uniref:putative phosphatidylglycerol/phosphatidylinositol transfer protein DDB_G0278295 n=1 Tax=Dysidea avara TaxID=196820 RepID=UPI00332D71E2
MKVVFVLAAFCLVLVSSTKPLVKQPASISCTIDFSCDRSNYDVTDLTCSFSPDPPQKGQNVTVTDTGVVHKEITGGKVMVLVKYNTYIKLIDKTYETCEFLEMFGEHCPVSPGPHTVVITDKVPSDLPGGKYNGILHGTDQDDMPMICGTFVCYV